MLQHAAATPGFPMRIESNQESRQSHDAQISMLIDQG
jgi:hypothetical protein